MTLQQGFDNENSKKQSKPTNGFDNGNSINKSKSTNKGVNQSSLQNIKSSPRHWDLFIFLAA